MGKQIDKFNLGNGLKGMRERLGLIGGRVSFNNNEIGFHTEILLPQDNQ
jgi:signal transduction histidine kinase